MNKKKTYKKRDPMACVLLATSFFKPKVIKNKKKYNRKRDKKVNYDLLSRIKILYGLN